MSIRKIDGQVLDADTVDGSELPTVRTIVTGSYSGNGVLNRQITTAFKCSLVVITSTYAEQRIWIIIPGLGSLVHEAAATHVVELTVILHATDGFQVGDDKGAANESAATYYYWAISE